MVVKIDGGGSQPIFARMVDRTYEHFDKTN